MQRLLLLFIVVLAMGLPALADDVVDSAARKCIDQRAGVTSGVVSFAITTTEAFGQRAQYVGVVREYTVTFDDTSTHYKCVLHWSGKGASWSDVLLKNEQGVLRDPGDWALHAQFSFDAESSQFNAHGIDPRLFGLVTTNPSSVGRGFPDSCLWFARSATSIESAEEVELDGVAAMKVVYRPRDTQAITAWYAERYGGNPVQVALQAGNSYRKLVQSSYERYANGPTGDTVWFPKRVIFTEQNGDVLLLREVMDVGNVEFGVALAEGEFSLSTVPVPAGRRVLDGSIAYVVDGSNGTKTLRRATSNDHLDPGTGMYAQSVDLSELTLKERQQGYGSRSRVGWLVGINVAFFVLLGAYLVRHRYLTRKG